MKSGKLILATLLVALAIPVSLAAQEHPTKHHKYNLVDVGTLGGPNVWFAFAGPTSLLGSNGTVTAGADTSIVDPICWNGPDCFLMHGFKWQEGVMTDLGALPGGSGKNDSQASWINDRGQTVGISTNGTRDSHFNPITHAVLWSDQGKIKDLGTLGGQYAIAQAINNRGQVVGVAENAIPDPYNLFDYIVFGISAGTQSRAFTWDKKTGMRDLGTLGTGNDAFAEYVNERGQIAGTSYTNTTPNPVATLCGNGHVLPTQDPFLWEKDQMRDLGTLGGNCGFPNALNRQGQVVGQSYLPGDLTFHPFLWTKPGPMKNLGTFGGDNGQANAINDAGEVVGKADFPGNQLHDAFLWKNDTMTDLGNLGKTSNAHNINSSGQIVGASVINDAGELRPFLWENGGPMVDLSTLVPPHPGVHLDGGDTWLNDRGEILITGTLSDGDNHAFLLTPCDDHHDDEEECEENPGNSAPATWSPTMIPDSPLSPFRVPLIRGYRTSGGGG